MRASQPCDFCLEEAKQGKVVRIARPATYQIKMNSGERLYLCEEHFYEYLRPEHTQ